MHMNLLKKFTFQLTAFSGATLIITALALIFQLCNAGGSGAADAVPPYATAVLPTPVFHTPDIAALFGGLDGKSLRLDNCGQIREVEFIAYPGTVFRIEAVLVKGGSSVYRVSTDDYPYPTDKGYFIDSRFVKTSDTRPSARLSLLPSRNTVIDNLLAARDSRYIWGGNFHKGIAQLPVMYPPANGRHLSQETMNHWQLRGVDCSGLLYEATGGYTPRNTSALVSYGAAVPIAGLDAAHIIRKVEPLDLIVWNGHVMIILDRQRVIESRLDCGGKDGGVKVRPLPEALTRIMKDRIAVDSFEDSAVQGKKAFVIRRWYKDRHPAD